MEEEIAKLGNDLLQFDFPQEIEAIIKVIGVGGGGGNAVTHMYREGINGVTFALCNTDNQALLKSEVPVKVQLGKETTKGLGAGNRPLVAKKAAEESIDDLKQLLSDGTEMVFITAGMGGGTGTGAAPVIARIAKEMGILTVGIVTIPFLFEGMPKIVQALEGVEAINKNVDALLVINNQRLIDMYGKLGALTGFKKADSTLTTAAKSISEIITVNGVINLDFADVKTTLKDGGVAIMNSGYGKGEGRVMTAFKDALNSPLLNSNDAFNAKRILFNVYFSSAHELMMDEMDEINDFKAKFKQKDMEVIWGMAIDEDLEDQVKITILATGFGTENIIPKNVLDEKDKITEAEQQRREADREEKERQEAELIDLYYGKGTAVNMGRATKPKPFIFKTIEQMDDIEIIEALIIHPAYNRSRKIMLDIAEQASARRAADVV